MTTEFDEYKRQIELRQEVLLRQMLYIFRRTEDFSKAAINAIGEISVDECIEGIKRVFCEEMDKLK